VLLSDCTAEPIGHDLARSNHDASVLLIELMLGRVASSSALVAALR
jgi:ureidoacrylate peracid hydrolase